MTIDIHVHTTASEFIDLEALRPGDPLAFHRSLPGYRLTPLLDVPMFAKQIGVGRVLVKDESERLGLPAFKMLGASWATARAMQREWFPHLAEVTVDALRAELDCDTQSVRRLVAATDGNHGRGVARMAGMFGLSCSIFVPAGTAAARIADIESEGAVVEVVEGSYDDAIRRSSAEAGATTLVISDTSWDGYTETPADVIVGYSTMFVEVDEALAAHGAAQPDLVLFQAGVGSFAAAGLRHYRRPDRREHPRTVIVEPLRANCLQRSAREGRLSEAPAPHTSTMAGLNCGLPSLLAWPVVEASADVFAAIDDEFAHTAMAAFASVGIVAGESGAATLGALLAASDDEGARVALGLTPDSVVLIINTEGATDPVNYAAQVGCGPHDVAAQSERRAANSSTSAM